MIDCAEYASALFRQKQHETWFDTTIRLNMLNPYMKMLFKLKEINFTNNALFSQLSQGKSNYTVICSKFRLKKVRFETLLYVDRTTALSMLFIPSKIRRYEIANGTFLLHSISI